MRSPTIRPASLPVAALAMLLTAACTGGDVAGPRAEQSFDAPLARTEMQTLDGLLGAPAWESFATMSPSFGLTAAATAAVSDARALAVSRAPLSAPEARRLATAAVERVWAVDAASAGAGLAALPPDTKGTTYVWDTPQRRYVAASGRTGAPVDGVRFVLYAVNPLSREPVISAEIGYADLTDVGLARPSGVGLRLLVVSGVTTFLDYTVIADGSATSGSLSVNGFLTDGTTRLTFGIQARGALGPEGRTGAVDFTFDVVDHGFGATGSARMTDGPVGQAQQVDLVVRVRDARVRFAVAGDGSAVDGSIFVNDQLFATVTGDPRQPAVRGAGGRALRNDEAQALGQMLGLADTAFRVLGALLEPVGAVFVLRSVP